MIYNIDIITIFPELFISFLENSIMKRAQIKKRVAFSIYNLRDFALDKHKTVDDIPYGGGCGMVLKPEPFFRAVNTIKKKYSNNLKKTKVVMLSPQGKLFSQKIAKEFSANIENLILLCGRYEGFDQRIEKIVDMEISIGDYVLNGGEIPAMVLSEAIVRLLPGVIGSVDSFKKDSFYSKYLDYPQYTRPKIFKGKKVPKVLLSGNHKKIEEWRKEQAIINTKKKRPELLK